MSTCVFMNVCAHGWVWVYLPMHKVQKKALDPLELQWRVPVEPQLVTQVLGSKVWPFSMTAQPGFWTDELYLHPLLLLYKRVLTHPLPWSDTLVGHRQGDCHEPMFTHMKTRAQKDKAPIAGVYCSMTQDVSPACCYCKITKVWLSSRRSKCMRHYL